MKYFDKYYIGLREDRETNSEKPLAFAVPDGNDKAAQKRKETVDKWVAGYSSAFDLPGKAKRVFEPRGKIYENKPMYGFVIVGWSGRNFTNNKTTRVLDPRGFELEIYMDNLIDIITKCEIANGEIKEKLAWLRDGSKNVLVPENSEAFKTAYKNFINDNKLNKSQGSTPKSNRLAHEPGDIIQNATGEWLYVGYYDVNHLIPVGKKVLDEKCTERFGTRISFNFEKNAHTLCEGSCEELYDELMMMYSQGEKEVKAVNINKVKENSKKEVFRKFYYIEPESFKLVSIGKYHIYVGLGRREKLAEMIRNNESFEKNGSIPFVYRVKKMNATKVEKTGFDASKLVKFADSNKYKVLVVELSTGLTVWFDETGNQVLKNGEFRELLAKENEKCHQAFRQGLPNGIDDPDGFLDDSKFWETNLAVLTDPNDSEDQKNNFDIEKLKKLYHKRNKDNSDFNGSYYYGSGRRYCFF